MGIPGYAGWIVTLDPPAVATGRTELDINSGAIQIGGTSSGTGPDWGQSEITAYESQQGSYGNNVADFVYPNRTVTIPLFISDDGATAYEDALADLRMKVGLLQREGGQILRQRLGGQAMYADIMKASLTVPDVYGETGGVEAGITLTLECLPDFYGDEITLDSASATGVLHAVLQESSAPAVIAGDYPARCRIIVTDTSGNDQKGAIWALRSRHYDSASTAASFYEAESLTAVNGTASATLSGSSSGHVMTNAGLPALTWGSILVTDLAGVGPLTHVGSYRMRARVYSAASTAPQLRLMWGASGLSVPAINDAVRIPGVSGFYLVDLGSIRIDPADVGSVTWQGAIQANVNALNDPVSIDALILQSLDESAGALSYEDVDPPGAFVTPQPGVGTYSDDASTGSYAWSNPGSWWAASVPSSAALSHPLKEVALGFAIPAAATIVGIRAQVFITDSGGAQLGRMLLYKAGVLQATPRVGTVVGGTQILTFGGSADTWGGGFAPADINNAGFGVAFQVANQTGVACTDAVSQILVTVYYTLPSGLTVAVDTVIPASKIGEIRTEDAFKQVTSGGVYGHVSNVIGDLPRLPPSAMEGRPCELLVKPSRGDLDTLADSALDSFTAQVKYRPCWMFRP